MGRHAAVPNNVIHSPANLNALYVGAAINTAAQTLQQKADQPSR